MSKLATIMNEIKLTSSNRGCFLSFTHYVLADVLNALCALSHNSCLIFYQHLAALRQSGEFIQVYVFGRWVQWKSNAKRQLMTMA